MPLRKVTILSGHLALAVVVTAACGYRPVEAARASSERLAVVGAEPLAGNMATVAALEGGVRRELAQAGALRSGVDFPRVRVELVRVDEQSAGVRQVAEGAGQTPGVLARGTRVGIVARAWIESGPSEARERDTGDVRATELMAREGDALLEGLRFDDATAACARRLGEALARRILGQPAILEEEGR